MKITPRDPKQCGEGKVSTMYVGGPKDDGNIRKRHMWSTAKNSYKIVREGPCRELKGSLAEKLKGFFPRISKNYLISSPYH